MQILVLVEVYFSGHDPPLVLLGRGEYLHQTLSIEQGLVTRATTKGSELQNHQQLLENSRNMQKTLCSPMVPLIFADQIS